jgi:hypothetical protein
MFKEKFIQAIHEKVKVRVTYFSKEDSDILVRKCAPMDYGPSRYAKEKNDRYHMWNYESDTKPHSMSLPAEQIKNIEILSETFDPAEFVNWTTNWIIPRDWGIFS